MGLTLYTAASLFAFVACAVLSPLVLAKGRRGRQTYLFSGLTLVAGIWCLFPFITGQLKDPAGILQAGRLIYSFALFVPPLFLHLTYSLLGLPRTLRERRTLQGAYLMSALLIPALPTDHFIRGVFRYSPSFGVVPGPLYTAFVAFFGITCTIGFIKLLQGYRQASGTRRNQLRYIFVSWFLAYLAGLLHFMPSYLHFEPFPHDFLVIAFVTLSAYAIARYRLMDIHLAVTRTAVFAVVYAVVLGIPLWVALAWQQRFEHRLGERWWVWLWFGCAVLATAAHYANLYFQRRAEARLLAEQRRYQGVLRQASQGMTLIKEMDRLLNLIAHLLTQKVRLKHAAIYLWDKQTERFAPKAARQWAREGEPPVFTLDDPLLEYLSVNRGAVVTEELALQAQGGRQPFQLVVGQLKSLEAAVVIPSFVEDHCVGFLVLGEKKSGALYSPDDLQVFQVLANQAALAIENAQFYEDLKATQAELFQTAKLASLGQMAGGMSHQINNRFHVLTILAGTMKAVLKETGPAGVEPERLKELWGKMLETFTKIEENALRGGDIVKTLLRFSRPGSVEMKPITLQEIVATARDVAQYKIDMSAIDFVQEWPQELPPVNGNLNQLADSFFNLITNAYDAIQTKKENLKPADYRGRITVSGQVAVNGMISVDVTDNGIGMSKQDMERLFVPFFTTKATAEKGTGLGLFVIKRILEHHGGNIQVHSAIGEGTTFTITLPAAAPAGRDTKTIAIA